MHKCYPKSLFKPRGAGLSPPEGGGHLKVRPIWLRKPEHVKAHIFLCALAYYVEWHRQSAWKEPPFADEELDKSRDTRAAALPPEPSASILAMKNFHKT